MKKRMFGVLFIFLFLTQVAVASPAQTCPTPLPSINPIGNLPLPGFNCGDASNTCINKCCTITIISPTPVPYTGMLATAWDFVIGKIKPAINPLLEQQKQISVAPCINGSPSTPGDQNNPACICIIAPTPVPINVLAPLCDKITNSSERGSCVNCSLDKGGVWTSIGCYNGNISSFISHLLEMGISLAGGISLLCIMFAAFQMQTSSGNAEKVKKAQELLTNCITGLMVIIFSILILKIIGVDILRIPGFN